MRKFKKEQLLVPFGMAGVLSYLGHTLFGDFLIEAHNPVTMPIERLISTITPYTKILLSLIIIYGICMLLFALGMYFQSFNSYAKSTKVTQLIIFIPMQIIFLYISLVNTPLYIYLAIITVTLSIAYSYLMMREYLKHDILKNFGRVMIILSSLITLLGIFFMFSLILELKNIGLAQRLYVFSLMAMIFSVSNFETFFDKDAALKMYNKNEL